MLWLISLVIILQACFNWLLRPAILLATPIFELRWLALLIVLFGVWLISGRKKGAY